MSVFAKDYARYYDLLYQGKQYGAEADYVSALIRRFSPEAVSVLELGCGTGRHAEHLGASGFDVHGVDQSPEMVERAQQRGMERSGGNGSIGFSVGDVTSYDSGRVYDSVISLFHVVSYQASNERLRGMFSSASRHLCAGGVFVFDAWYGPAVLTQLPSVRVRRLEDERVSITRIAEPKMDFSRNTVEVRYSIHCVDKESGSFSEFQESHVMRYLFEPEVEMLLAEAGFDLVLTQEWMGGGPASDQTWSVCFAAVKRAIR